MNKVSVRCWEIENYRPGASAIDHILITYPEDNSGHELITCKSCGELYAVTVVKEVYIGPPLDEKVVNMKCINCGVFLDGNFAYYPDTYLAGGDLIIYQRDTLIPDDNESLIKEFYGIYE
ncbi:hypothetical protein [Shewanella denitrificans]|jgi:hypothetical protein|uniref:hypothetical protein n=1 Tax=Shewanella denitrificans TaxID=192073 RepID=UPI00059DE5C7|nr:hypothetical protein [Shewanella denitrificans]